MSSPPAPAAAPPSLVLVPATPPLSTPRAPSSPAPSTFSRRGRSSPRIPRIPPPPLPAPSLVHFPLELGAAHILELYLVPGTPAVPRPSPSARSPPLVRLPFTSLLVLADAPAPTEVVVVEEETEKEPPTSPSSKKKHKKQSHTRSRSMPARPRIPASWRLKNDKAQVSPASPPEVEYLKVDAKLEWAMEALGF